VRHVSRCLPLAYWEYHQHQDEASSLEIANTLLHDYLKSLSEPVNLIGHGTGGLLGLIYARRYPHKVKSLTLLGVGANPAVDWQAHYYHIRKLLPCSQEIILARMVKMLFGYQDRINTQRLVKILQQDLNTAPSPHSLYQQGSISAGRVSMPLMVCGSENDGIVDSPALQRWRNYLKEEDVLWINPMGHHFFHYFFPEVVAKQVIKFWHGVNQKLLVASG
jgi:pimeloyl-ACP methyl ester carboxylesterase